MNNRVSRPVFALFAVAAIALSACSSDEPSTPTVGTSASEPATTSVVESPGTPVEESGPAAIVPESAAVTAPPATPPAAEAADAEPANAGPTQYVVKGVVTQWAPMVLFVQPGDQIVFKQMLGHDTETIEGMIPEGSKPWKSKLGQEGYAVAPEVPGVYIYKCNPHVSLGMIGAIVVGEAPPANMDAVEAHPQNKGMIGRAIRKLKQALEKHEAS